MMYVMCLFQVLPHDSVSLEKADNSQPSKSLVTEEVREIGSTASTLNILTFFLILFFDDNIPILNLYQELDLYNTVALFL